MPPLYWLLLVCAGGHRTAHTWDLYQVGETSYKQNPCVIRPFGAYLWYFFTLIYIDSWNLLLGSLWQTNQTVVSHLNTAEWPVNEEAYLV